MTAAELAHDLALPRELVAWNLRRFRSEGGWFCVLKLPPCTECGGPVVGPPKLMTHQACLPARKARWVREKRQQLKATLSPEALTERRDREREGCKRYYQSLPPERQAFLFAKWLTTTLREYQITREAADNHHSRWTEEDELYVLANLGIAAREVALALGRTSYAVYARRQHLLRQERGPAQGGC